MIPRSVPSGSAEWPGERPIELAMGDALRPGHYISGHASFFLVSELEKPMFMSLPAVPANVVSDGDATASWVERPHDERCEPVSWRYAAGHVSGVPWPQEQEADEGAEVPAAVG